jgi:pimeloyl-ACP methyl ester carboxylesterase
MNYFDSNGFRIAYDDVGTGYPIILLHGFAIDRRQNWKLTGWTRTLVRAGYRVISPDARGHGRSDKPTDPADYVPEGIAGDVVRLMDHLGIRQAALFGYSMGGRNAAWLLSNKQSRFSAVVIAGTGENLLTNDDNRDTESLAMPRMVPIYERVSKFGGRAGALSACLLGSFPSINPGHFSKVRTPVLVIAGSRDTTAGSPYPLADAIPKAKAVVVPGRSHVSVLTDGFFRGAVLGFLGDRWQDDVSQNRNAA